ncbi:MAG TPA: hypothetical protein VGS97_08085 [Actinocrinis sp.]|uniref:hypothetical protein n=1 Tax=Actinocrinis sp. TaxID=1920516 RepID=UPI002DDC97CF|nr:hypothetical protein [Actinocrinis sp.]HEV2344036.1 hypothetical protein [Actinocrinis sp.]
MVRAEVAKWRRHAEQRFERLIAAVAEASGLPFRSGLTIKNAAARGLDIPGEIDVLIAAPERHILWVVEAKHLKEPFGPMEIAFHVAEFHGPEALAIDASTNDFRQFQSRNFKSHDDALSGKVDAVRRHIRAAFRALDMDPSQDSLAALTPSDECQGDGWQVFGVFITSHVEVAAFTADPTPRSSQSTRTPPGDPLGARPPPSMSPLVTTGSTRRGWPPAA